MECLPGNDKAEEGCAGSSGIWSYADQLTRDYPSFSQVRKVINDKSKLKSNSKTISEFLLNNKP